MKAVVSFRLGVSQWLPVRRYRDLLGVLAAHPGMADELAFFTSETHPPLPLAELERRAALLAERMAAARRHGFRAGINLLATVGHHEENLANSLDGPFQRMRFLDGRECRGSFCPNDEGYLHAYVEPAYRALAAAGPDFLWIDDDVRLAGHHPIPAGCFCDRCLERFAATCGRRYTGVELARAFVERPVRAALALRRAWLEHNRRTLLDLLERIEGAVHAVAPRLTLGFMSGERFYEGYGIAAWAEALAGPDRVDVAWRPGGGFYADETLDSMIDKSHEIGRQVSCLPPWVASIQSEVENFPYQRLRKAARTTALEAAAHVAAGCTGAAFNVLSMYDEPLDEYGPLLAEIARRRPFLDRMVELLGRAPALGLLGGWHRDAAATQGLEGEVWPAGEGPTSAPVRELLQLGIPPAYGPEGARVTALAGDLPLAFAEEELLQVLAGGVYLDGQALARLHEMGLGEHTGFAVERWVEADAIEELAEHPLNGGFAGRRRDGRQSFPGWLRPAAVLARLRPEAETLARLVDYAGRPVGDCGGGVFENRLGGRICVAGYYPWRFLHSLPKAAQLKAAMRWLSRGSLDGYVASFHRLALWIRRPRDGVIAAVLVNASLDPALGVELVLRTRAGAAVVTDMDGGQQPVSPVPQANAEYRSYGLPEIAPWRMQLVVAEE